MDEVLDCDVGPQDDGHERRSSRFCAIFVAKRELYSKIFVRHIAL